MNKKSKIKTTLDSLFTGGKLPSGEPAKMDSKPAEKPWPSKTQKTPELPKEKKDVEVQKPAPVETPASAAPVVPAVITPETAPTLQKTSEPAEEKIVLPQVQPAAPAAVVPAPNVKKIEDAQVQKSGAEIGRAPQIQDNNDEHLVIFVLGKELYGVNIHAVESIIKLQSITEVPGSASFILGVTNLRGTVVPVLDLRKRFNMPTSEDTANTRIIIVNAEGSKVGIVVDEVDEVLKVSRDAIQPPPPMSTTIESAFINGIARIDDRLIILLDLEKVLISSTRQHNR